MRKSLPHSKEMKRQRK